MMRKKQAAAGHLQLIPVGSDDASALRFAMAGLIHELYYKKPHFPGGMKGFTRAEHDAANTALSGIPFDSPRYDPISAMLHRAAQLAVRAGATSTLEQLVETWERSESPLNSRCRALAGLLGPELTGALVGRLIPDLLNPKKLWLADLSSRYEGPRSDGRFGQPDLLLDGDNCTLLIEMKVRGKKARTYYDVKQLLDYLTLASALRDGGCTHPIIHVVLAPAGANGLFKHASSWLVGNPTEGRLTVAPCGFVATLENMTGRRRPIPTGRIERALKELPLTPVIYVSLERLLSEAEPLLSNLGDWEAAARDQHARLWEFAVPTIRVGVKG
jgi:hypothetical protein